MTQTEPYDAEDWNLSPPMPKIESLVAPPSFGALIVFPRDPTIKIKDNAQNKERKTKKTKYPTQHRSGINLSL
jgi:hypothetical protein